MFAYYIIIALFSLRTTASPALLNTTRLKALTKARAEEKFVFAALGDSWASGIRWSQDTSYDAKPDGCRRYNRAWSTFVNKDYPLWGPDHLREAQFEFVACSGARLQDMQKQMDLLTAVRPKLVLMEVGGNNADFYPLADACIFHQDLGKDYGKRYEVDDPDNPEGACRYEINMVHGRVATPQFKQDVKNAIDSWRAHPAVTGNSASLFIMGYARFFADGSECDSWDFTVGGPLHKGQSLLLSLRQDINKLVDVTNNALKTAIEEYSDQKLQYIDINAAFNDHRFCVPNMTWWDQLNYGSKVWIWNQPTRFAITVKNAVTQAVSTFIYPEQTIPTSASSVIERLMGFPLGPVKPDGDSWAQVFQDPGVPEITMQVKSVSEQLKLTGSDAADGRIGRTLHPTESGHETMAKHIVVRLFNHYHRSQ